MKPAPFEYHAPASVDEALALLQRHGTEAKVLAGGQSLIPTMNFRLAQPAVLVDINGLTDLAGVTSAGEGLRIGAMTRQRAVERSDLVAERAPLLHEAMPFIAHAQIRNRGTMGGSVAHADPAAELPAVMLAAGAALHLRGPSGARTVAADDFFTGLFTTALAPDELLTAIELPAPEPGTGTAFMEVARRHGDYALVGVAASVRVREGLLEDVRVALLSVGDGPVFGAAATSTLAGEAPSPEAIQAASARVAEKDIDPSDDIHATAKYRRHLADVLTRRALTRAVERARIGSAA